MCESNAGSPDVETRTVGARLIYSRQYSQILQYSHWGISYTYYKDCSVYNLKIFKCSGYIQFTVLYGGVIFEDENWPPGKLCKIVLGRRAFENFDCYPTLCLQKFLSMRQGGMSSSGLLEAKIRVGNSLFRSCHSLQKEQWELIAAITL